MGENGGASPAPAGGGEAAARDGPPDGVREDVGFGQVWLSGWQSP